MKVTKDYMEWYVLLRLIHCYDKKLRPMMDGKSENPDCQSESLDIGLEITEALELDDGRIRHVINQYFGQGLDGQMIKDQVEKKYPEYSHLVDVVENTACFSLSGDMLPKIERMIISFVRKTKTLNGHYKRFGQNWLYVFASELFMNFDLPKVYQAYQKRTAQYPIQFDKVFINAYDRIFVLGPDGLNEEIPISENCLKQLKKEAMLCACGNSKALKQKM